MWVSVAEIHDYWGIDEGHDVWFHQDGEVRPDPTSDDWYGPIANPEGSKLIQLDVGRDGKVWGTDGEKLFWRKGITTTIIQGTEWELIEDSFGVNNVAHCTNGLVYIVNSNNEILYRIEGNEQNEWKGTGWKKLTGNTEEAKQVTCGLNGEVLYVSLNGNVFYRDGVDYGSPHGTAWLPVDLDHPAVCASAGETGQVWILLTTGDAIIMDKTTEISGEVSGWNLITAPRHENNGLVQLDVGVWQVWGVNKFNEVYEKVTSAENVQGEEWT